MLRLAIVTVLLGAAAAREEQTVTPVQKVLQMMNDMKLKGIKEKQDEEVNFAKFITFCENTEKAKTKAIADGKAQSEQLAADIMKFTSDAKILGEEIGKLDGSIAIAEEDKASATDLRKKEKADYEKTHAEYVENVADLAQAKDKLKTMMATSPGASAASLLQTLASKFSMPAHAKKVLLSFLESASTERKLEEGLEMSAPEAAVFESQSGGIVGMMEELEAKLQDEKATLEKEEVNARHSYDMMAQTLTDKIEQESATRKSKISTKKQKEEDAAKAKGDKSDTDNGVAEDTTYLSDLKDMCTEKSADFQARQKLRAEELEALDEAIEIIASGDVSGAADTHLPGFVQQATSLVQLRSSVSQPSQSLVSSFLKAQGDKLNSRLLSALAVRVGEDPFGKVKKMIKDMVFKLMEEATEEAEHKGFCDTELTTNKQTRDAKSTTVDELTAEITQLTAEAQKLSVEISDLSDQVKEIDDAVAKATENRNAEKAKNTATISDAVTAKAAVEKALAVLKTFYDKAATATAMTQTGGDIEYDPRAIGMLNRGASMMQTRAKGVADDAPSTFSKPFTGMGGEGGIMGMLEVIVSDFARLEEETKESEFAAAKEYDAFMADSSEDKAVKQAEMKHKTNTMTKRNSDAATAKRDLKATQEELDAALAYYEKLKPSCVDAGESYEERVARRKAEIESLQEALKILSGDTIA